MKYRFYNDKVYNDETGEFLYSYYECGITRKTSKKQAIKLVNERAAYWARAAEEESLREQGII